MNVALGVFFDGRPAVSSTSTVSHYSIPRNIKSQSPLLEIQTESEKAGEPDSLVESGCVETAPLPYERDDVVYRELQGSWMSWE